MKLLLLILFLSSCESRIDLDQTSKDNIIPNTELLLIKNQNIIIQDNQVYGENSSIFIILEFSEKIISSYNPRLKLEVGSNIAYANYVGGTNSNYIQFEYLVSSSDIDSNGIKIISLDQRQGFLKNQNNKYVAEELTQPSNISSNNIIVNSDIPAPEKINKIVSGPSLTDEINIVFSNPNSVEDISNFIIYYREKDSEEIWKNIDSDKNIFSFNFLDFNKEYEIKIAAKSNVIGESSDINFISLFDIKNENPLIWIDSLDLISHTTYQDKDRINLIIDKAQGLNIIENDISKQPEYRENIQNGLPSILFSGQNQGLEASFYRTENEGLTVFLIGKLSYNDPRKSFFEIYSHDLNNNRAFFFNYGYSEANTNYGLNTSKFNLWTVEDYGLSSTMYENDNLVFMNKANWGDGTSFLGDAGFLLGDDKTGGDAIDAYISEILIFDKNLDSDMIEKIKEYCKTKWDL